MLKNYNGYIFKDLFAQLRDDLLKSNPVDVGEWQSTKINKPMRELLHVTFSIALPESAVELAGMTGAHLPWAEDHFQERVGGEPLNPAPSEAWWPFAKKTSDGTNRDHKSEGEAFSHTYPERMWPKYANEANRRDNGAVAVRGQMWGIRFEYGDLADVVKQLSNSPMTRQAYLPIWFPEDTGGAGGRRVPCTLGYHFIIRNGKLDISYFMRSTDLLRHFQDDIYMAGRLAQWMVRELNGAWDYKYNEPQEHPLEVGDIIFHTANLHIFDQDVEMLNWMKSQNRVW